MAARKPISLVKGADNVAQTWPDEPNRFTDEHVDPFLLWSVKRNASDITFQSDKQIYHEIDGVLYPATYRALDAGDMAVMLQKIYGPEAQARLASGTDLDLSYELKPDRYTRIRFRVNITPVLSKGRDAAQITMRVLPNEPPTMLDLNIEEDIVKNWAPRQGVVIITGPTGSGKTTLLAAGNRMMLERAHGCGKMLTYEAPIEYVYDAIKSPRSLVAQTEIPRHLPDFARGVRNALRRKPNIILVGEARDRETISAAIEAAQTGHAVYTTTHTTGVASTIQRMVATFDANERSERAYALMETLRMIVTQALVPKVGGGRLGVREWMKFPDEVREKLLDMDFTEWPANLQRMLPTYGQSMAISAGKAFEAGLIERRWYLLLSSSTGAGG
ncbi:type IV pilus twitching motility protein PilT [Micavibrio aeruginosavorus]|uniref:Dot/Icm secretion system ATPase DotB n=1 Tax=Micavibrio aeruginosavorus (strain ARL-13) TaxID=856793 RepID=G2KNU4_MICAA|nr:ATPase, T2SS/T4P/T4SS family [Micavibrio aeruginosavorus]AEP10739.1 dot/Icm secretion system ATPase DotB [Micavibrio aeruginosavorus ARL-13]